MKKYKYITISRRPVGYCITNIKSNGLLGIIEYYRPWKRWVLCPELDSVWSDDCLLDVIDFIKNEIPMAGRR